MTCNEMARHHSKKTSVGEPIMVDVQVLIRIEIQKENVFVLDAEINNP